MTTSFGAALKKAGQAVIDRLIRPFQFLRQSRKSLILFFSSLLVFPLTIGIAVVFLPVINNPFEAANANELKDNIESAPDTTSAAVITSRRELGKKMASMEVDHAFWQSRLQLAKSDSISLALDLIDSLVSLDVKGVSMRRSKILRYRSSGLAKRWRAQGRLHQWLATPFIAEEELATLPKAPIRIKEAPKDTIEANESKGEDLPIEQRDAEFTLHFDRNLTLSVEQAQPPSLSGRWREFLYDLRRNFDAGRDAVIALLHGQLPQHRMWIEIEIPREDAKAIYRALPSHTGLALRL